MRGGGESGHVDADLGDDDLGGALTDPRDRRQQTSSARTKGRLASSMRVSSRAIMSARWSMCSRCRVHISACWSPKRPAQANVRSGILRAHHAARQVGQHGRVAFPGDQRLDHVPGRQGGQRRGHRVNLDSAVLEDLGQALQLAGALLDELLAVAGQLSDRRDLRRWDETAPQQPALGQLRQPYRVKGIALSAGHVLDMPGVDQQHLHRVARPHTGRGRPAPNTSRSLPWSRA